MYTVQYASSRAELWRWYWKAWARPRGLWRFHVLIAAAISVSVTAVDQATTIDAWHVLFLFMCALLGCIALLPLWPQFRFKSAVRTLTIHAGGFDTAIGLLSASRAWSEVRSIEESGDAIVITGMNNNAMIVPSRAFASAEERLRFYEAAVRLNAQATSA